MAIFFFLSQAEAAPLESPRLSGQAKISILTCGAGPDLYEAFGHTALRIQDPAQGLDLVFNYGVFDFNQPNFYGNFAKGSMRYMLGVSVAEEFLMQYRYYKRSVSEQVLNLDSVHKQQIMDYININLRPENREYFYDYFKDNCSTRIVDVLDSALQHQVRWHFATPDGKATYRSLIYEATVFQPWGRLGIDLGLGALIDKPLEGSQLDFLPQYLEKDLDRAEILIGQVGRPLVIQKQILYESDVLFGAAGFWLSPSFIFSMLLLISVLVWWKGSQWPMLARIWACFLLLVTGILGWVELLIWLFTNHTTAAWNYNILWANPLFLFMGFLYVVQSPKATLILTGVRWYLLSVLVCWFLVPQVLNTDLIPLVAALVVALFSLGGKKTEPTVDQPVLGVNPIVKSA